MCNRKVAATGRLVGQRLHANPSRSATFRAHFESRRARHLAAASLSQLKGGHRRVSEEHKMFFLGFVCVVQDLDFIDGRQASRQAAIAESTLRGLRTLPRPITRAAAIHPRRLSCARIISDTQALRTTAQLHAKTRLRLRLRNSLSPTLPPDNMAPQRPFAQ